MKEPASPSIWLSTTPIIPSSRKSGRSFPKIGTSTSTFKRLLSPPDLGIPEPDKVAGLGTPVTRLVTHLVVSLVIHLVTVMHLAIHLEIHLVNVTLLCADTIAQTEAATWATDAGSNTSDN